MLPLDLTIEDNQIDRINLTAYPTYLAGLAQFMDFKIIKDANLSERQLNSLARMLKTLPIYNKWDPLDYESYAQLCYDAGKEPLPVD